MTYTLLLSIVLVCNSAYAAEWTREDSTLEAAYQASLVIDYIQTRQALKSEYVYEKNPLLGDHPSIAELNRAVILYSVAHISIANALQKPWRTDFQISTLVISAVTIVSNHKLGVRIKF